MTLLEVLASSSVLILLVNVIISIMMSGNRLSATSMNTLDRIQRSTDVRESLLRDVKSSYGVVPSVLHYETSDKQLVLELPPLAEKPEARHYAVYGRMKSQNQLDRLEITMGDGSEAVESFETFPLWIEGFSVKQSGKLVSIELDANQTANRPAPAGVKRKPPVKYEFTAAPRSVAGGRAS
jgi:hypothetical protein